MIGAPAAIIAIDRSRHNHRSKPYRAREAAHSATVPRPEPLEPRQFVSEIRDMGVIWIEMATGSAANERDHFGRLMEIYRLSHSDRPVSLATL